MCNNVLRIMMMSLVVALSASFANAQVHVGDVLCEGNRVVSPAFAGSEAIGVVFYVDGTGQHGWAVALHDSGILSWAPNCYNTPLRDCVSQAAAAADLDGYNNTRIIIEQGEEHPAFQALDFDNGWYLPAIGQLKRLYSKLDKVNESLSAVGGDEFSSDIDPNWECWSSTEYNVVSAWYMTASGQMRFKDESYNGTKDGRRVVRSVINF